MPVITVGMQCPMCGALGHSNISIDQATGFAHCTRANHQFVSLHHAPGLSPDARQAEDWLIPVPGGTRNVALLALLKEDYPLALDTAGAGSLSIVTTTDANGKTIGGAAPKERPADWGCAGPIIAGEDMSFRCKRCGYQHLTPSRIAEASALPFDHMSVLQAHRDTPLVTK